MTFTPCALGAGFLTIGQLVIAILEKVIRSKKETGEDALVHRASIEEYKDNLIKIIDISKKNSIRCILLTRPFIELLFMKKGGKKEWKNTNALYADISMIQKKAIRMLG